MPMKPRLPARLTYFLFSLPALILYSIIWGYNFVQGFIYSTTNWDGLSKTWKFIGLANYEKILRTARFWKALGFTARYSVMLLVLVLTIALILALILSKRGRLTTLVRSIFFFPAMVSLVTASLVFEKIFYYALPALGKALGIAFLSRNIFANPDTAILGILAVNLWQGCAIPTILLIAGLQNIPPELLESAAIDGAGAFQRFRAITLPFILPVISVVFVLTLKAGITVFDYVLILTEGGPAGSTNSVSMLIYLDGLGSFKFGYANAEAFLLFILIALISFVQIRLSSRKEVA
jgi:raffinose/stachyose/melibiose transport system permease protein